MKHIKNFETYNEGLIDNLKGILGNPIKYRQDMPVSKRMKENDIKQIFDKDPNDKKKEILTKSYLVHGENQDKVATLEIKSADDYGRPIISMIIHEKNNPEKIIKRKSYFNQEKAIHEFLDYWEAQTPEGREKNKEFRLKKF